MSGKQGKGHPILQSSNLPVPERDLSAQERGAALSSQAGNLPNPTVRNQALRLALVISASLIPQCKTTCSSGSLDNPAPRCRFVSYGFT